MNGSRIGTKIERFGKVDSTNDIAKSLARDGAREGTVIIADSQSGGRGRYERCWSSPSGGIFVSVILRPDTLSGRVSLLPLLAGSAVANTLNGLYGIGAQVKWPNDVLIGERKVSGILSEIDTDDDFVIVGIGINANFDPGDLPKEVRKTATTLKAELKREVSKTELLRRLLSELDDMYNRFCTGSLKISCSTIKKQVKVITKTQEFLGKAEEIDETGALILRLGDGSTQRIISGECIHLSEGIDSTF
ncbi:MAG: biotin--[acetyl-CoA-carboxylase] ligase [Candidatus Hydrothermarchaeaceae archaeon]